MAGTGAPIPVEPPPLQPAWGGILDAARVITDQPVHDTADPQAGSGRGWGNGISFEDLNCDASQTRDPCDVHGSWDDVSECVGDVIWLPFIIEGEYRRSLLNGLRLEAGRARARQQLDACRSCRIEQELSSDSAGVGNPTLGDATDLIVVPALALSPQDALVALIGEIGECGCNLRHVIHATPRVVAHWFADSAPLVERQGQTLYTFNGHIISAGCYDGLGPNGAPDIPGDQWVYATGLVEVRLGPVVDSSDPPIGALRLRQNEAVWRAQQLAVAAYSPGCCRVGVQVAMTGGY